jgi:hypothetical protein
MKNLLVVTALVEILTGVALTFSPALPVSLPTARRSIRPLIRGRRRGGCWRSASLAGLAREDGRSRAARGLVAAMLLYNAAAVAVLLHAGLRLKLSGIGLWPAVLLHLALAVWCIGARPVRQGWSRE